MNDYHQQAYLWVSIVLAMPIFLWPGSLLLGFTPSFGVTIEQNWIVAACSLLMATVVADAALSYRPHLSHAIGSALWVVVASSSISLVVRKPEMAWLIAMLLAAHSFHALHCLWRGTDDDKQWWHWVAWSRDSSTAFIMFFWLSSWPK
ncbi:MAG: hypothetical protein Q9M20_07530 [Mariprofundaceae bacterium]|nr:hypothetical protein [Mariprofundaceae bacterium]